MRKLNLVLVASALAAAASAVETVPAASVETAKAEVKASVSCAALMKEAFDAFAAKLGISYGAVTPDGRFYEKGEAAVDADVAAPTFVKSRAMAYERAYLNALSQFVIDFYGRETANKVSEYYSNASSDAEDSPVAGARGLAEKIGLLAEAKVDRALAAEGVPPEKYRQASVVEKRTLLQDAIRASSVKKALHASSGCVPVKTFETRDEKGRYRIGVVVRYDRTSRTLAACFKAKTRPAVARASGLALKDVLPAEDAIASEFGVRLYYDETGTPALLSFGQFGSSYTGKSERLRERAEDQALRQALALADAGLTMFIDSFVDATEESTTGEEVVDARIFTDDGNVTPEEVSKIVDVYRKNVRQTGSDTLAGRSTVYRATVKHPCGHPVAVVVRRWSFETLDAVRGMERPPKPAKAPSAAAPATVREAAGARAGQTFDF